MAQRQRLVSKVKHSQIVPILKADGTTDTVTLQGRSKLELQEGSRVHPNREREFVTTITMTGLSPVQTRSDE